MKGKSKRGNKTSCCYKLQAGTLFCGVRVIALYYMMSLHISLCVLISMPPLFQGQPKDGGLYCVFFSRPIWFAVMVLVFRLNGTSVGCVDTIITPNLCVCWSSHLVVGALWMCSICSREIVNLDSTRQFYRVIYFNCRFLWIGTI